MAEWLQFFADEFQQQHPDQDFLNSDEYQAELLAFADYERPDADFGDLDNEIHILFQPLAQQPGWLPFLRLASKILQEPSLLPYWHALICVDQTLLYEHTLTTQAPMTCFNAMGRDLTVEEIAHTRNSLHQASFYLYWSSGPDLDDPDDETDESGEEEESDNGANSTQYERAPDAAWTLRIPHGHPSFPPMAMNPPGSRALIGIDCFYAKALGPLSSLNDAQKLRVGFHLTQTIIHELSHALFMIRWPLTHRDARFGGFNCDRHEAFFRNDAEIELGYVTESAFWGGEVTLSNEGRYLIKIGKWPGFHNHTKGLTAKGLMYLGRRGPRQWRTMYFMTMQWMEKQFKKAFWEGEVRENGPRALRFPKQLGLRGFNVYWREGDETYDSDDSSVAMHEDEELVVREDQPARPEERRPIGRDAANRKWPSVGAVLNSWLAKHYAHLHPEQQWNYVPHSGDEEEPVDCAWHIPVHFVREGPPYSLVVDKSRTAPLLLDRRYFDIYDIAAEEQAAADEADRLAAIAQLLAQEDAMNRPDPPPIY